MSGPKSTARERQGRQEQEALLARLRKLLEDEPISREISMFGARADPWCAARCCAVPAKTEISWPISTPPPTRKCRSSRALPRPRWDRARDGPGWLNVAADSIADDHRLQFWLDACLALNRAQTQPQS